MANIIKLCILLHILSLFSAELLASESILHYQCGATAQSIYHGGELKGKLTKEGNDASAYEINVVYPRSIDELSLDIGKMGYKHQQKSAFYLYGSYVDLLSESTKERKSLDFHIMGISARDLVSANAKSNPQTQGINSFGVHATLLGVTDKEIRAVLKTPDTFYLGGTVGENSQIGPENYFLPIVESLGNQFAIRAFISKQRTFALAQVPYLFTRLEAEPDSFSMRLFFVHIAKDIADLNLEPIFQRRVTLNCVRQADMSEEVYLEIRSHSKTYPLSDEVTNDEDIQLPLGPTNRVVPFKENGESQEISSSDFLSLVESVSETDFDIQMDKDSVMTVSALVGGSLIVLRYAKSFTPAGAFLMALGLGSAQAADVCHFYLDSPRGFETYFTLEPDQKLSVARKCPKLTARIVDMSRTLNQSKQKTFRHN